MMPNKRDVSVYLVASRSNVSGAIAAVPSGCRCIFVNPSLLATWVASHSHNVGQLELDRGQLLTFMLLHEVGHIHHGTAAGDFVNGELSQLNNEPSIAKEREKEADDFAAALIRQLRDQTSSGSLAANWISIEISKLCWNMQAHRSLDEFGATAIGEPAVFFDQNYSHPNLAWRMLRSNDLIQRTDESGRLLKAFEEAQQRGHEPKRPYSKE